MLRAAEERIVWFDLPDAKSSCFPSNIAEGQQRGSVKEFRQFLQIARGSAAELATQLQLSGDIYKLEVKNLVSDVEEVQKMLYGLIQKL